MAAVLNAISDAFHNLVVRGQSFLDSFVPPETQSAMSKRLKAFATANPKLSTFLLANTVLTGFPLLLFAAFALTVFVFSLVAAFLLGLLVALCASFLAIGVALVIILPVVFMTTFTASVVWLCAMSGYFILKMFNEGENLVAEGASIGEALNTLTGGRLGWLTQTARVEALLPDVGRCTSQKGISCNEILSDSTTQAPTKLSGGAESIDFTGHTNGTRP